MSNPACLWPSPGPRFGLSSSGTLVSPTVELAPGRSNCGATTSADEKLMNAKRAQQEHLAADKAHY